MEKRRRLEKAVLKKAPIKNLVLFCVPMATHLPLMIYQSIYISMGS